MSRLSDISKYERIALLALGGIIVLGLLGLVLSGRSVNPTAATPLRLLLALAAAVFGGFLPGAFRIGYTRNGLAMRAAGAAAFFVLVWMGGPRVAPSLVQAPSQAIASQTP